MSHKWHVIIERSPQKVLRKLDTVMRSRIEKAIDQLSENPFPIGHRKIVGQENIYRVRIGGWRIIYEVEKGKLIILIIEYGTMGHGHHHGHYILAISL